MMDFTEKFISTRLTKFVGQNIDLVGSQIEDIIDASPYCWRWLEPDTEVSSADVRVDRVNVHVTRKHKITRMTAG